MVFEGMVTARRVVDIVEELAICKKQLEDVERKVERKGDWVFDKLEDVTMDLADIAHKLFTHCMNDAGVGENICNLPPSASSTSCPPDNEDYQMEDIGIKVGENGEHAVKTARICRHGTSCGFARRGRCVFYHPEPGKSMETLLDATPNCTFGSRCERRPFCRFKHPEGNCHFSARGYFKD